METSQRQISLFGKDKSTSLQGDSRASRTAKQESALERKMTATSGRRCLEQFEKFNRPGLWAKTFVALLIGMEGWYSMKCRLTWKMKATKSHRFYFQLVPSTHPIEGIGFGLLATPQAIDGQGKGKGLRLKTGNRNPESPGSWRGDLKDYAHLGMLPTPATRDYKGGNSIDHLTRKDKSEGNSHQDQLPNYIKLKTGSSSQLNPQFVMEMMGFPPDWTLMPFLKESNTQENQSPSQSGETNPSKPEEMPSSTK